MADEENQPLDDEGKEMSFVEHLEELRMHIIRSLLVIGACAVFIFFATKFIFEHILLAPLRKDFLTYRALCYISNKLGMGDAMCYGDVAEKVELQTFDMGEAFLLHIKICLVGGLIMAFPYVLWELWRFIRPGLYQREQKATRGVVFITSGLFLLGVSFGYYILSPFAINFLAGYDLPMINQEESFIKASSFINYMIMFTLPAGIVFELPVIVYYLARIGLVTPEFMRKYRRHSIIIILFISALVTPPDVMTQILIGIPIYILYELSINIAARQAKRRAEEMGMSEDED